MAYNEKWKEEGKFPVSIAALGGNVGTGKKKAVIVAYDLAYMQYSIDAVFRYLTLLFMIKWRIHI